MATSAVRFSLPSPSLFKFPPASIPSAVPPPTSEFTYAPRFEIPPKLYNHLLSAAYPITFAVLYGSLVPYLNRINRERGNKPWAFSKTWIFFMAVVAHNIFLAAYSGWTFTGILDAFRHAWPGLQGENGLAGAVDALCKIHGPRGLGSGVAFNSTTNIWTAPNVAINLTPLGLPDNTDLGRLWNEGVAYYGWLFYLSKFYEILDTAIVLAKGKTVSPLQAYHHAGALIGVWAGIRYMSPPISMFILVNSGIHAVMVSYPLDSRGNGDNKRAWRSTPTMPSHPFRSQSFGRSSASSRRYKFPSSSLAPFTRSRTCSYPIRSQSRSPTPLRRVSLPPCRPPLPRHPWR